MGRDGFLSSSLSSMTSIGFVTFLLLLCCLFYIPIAHGIGDKESDLPLYEDTPTHCDKMIDLHRWEGTCCSLNVTEGNGCILNVRDGYCQIRGQVWTLNYTSTSDIACPPSEYSLEMLGIKPPRTQPPTEERSGTAGAYFIDEMRIMKAAAVAIGTICML